jgi:uncharacterized lipoprotein YajG
LTVKRQIRLDGFNALLSQQRNTLHMMKKTIVIALAAFLLSGCKNFYHSSCPGFAGENPEARDGIRSVIETCN